MRAEAPEFHEAIGIAAATPNFACCEASSAAVDEDGLLVAVQRRDTFLRECAGNAVGTVQVHHECVLHDCRDVDVVDGLIDHFLFK